MNQDIRVARPIFPQKKKILKDIGSVLDSGRLMTGPYTASFEKKFAEYCGIKHAVAVNSCTAALEIVLRYIGVSGGDVIVPTNTFIATSNAVLFAGGRPVLADVKDGTYYLDPDEVKRLISKDTKAVIAVHIAGLIPPEIEEISKICRKHKIPLVEDCAHAIGASYKNKPAGSFGIAGCFSFYPTKTMTTGTGGMITTADGKLAEFARSVRLHGAGTGGLAEIVNIGSDWFMDEISAVLGVYQLESLGRFLKNRRQIASRYDALLSTTCSIKKLPVSNLSKHAYYKYPVQIERDIDVSALKKSFRVKYGFELESLYWPTCHLQPVYREMFGSKRGRFPNAEAILAKQVTLPIHAVMRTEDAEYAFRSLISEIELKERGR